LDEENQPRYRREHALKLAERATVATTFTAEHPPYLYLRDGMLDSGAGLAEIDVKFPLPV
jgi:hypothetical protein